MPRNPNCTKCPLHEQGCKTICLWGSGHIPAKMMFIGEAPGFVEDHTGIPFTGPAGKLKDIILDSLGIRSNSIYITNCFKCRPYDNKLPGKRDKEAWFQECSPYLMEEIHNVRPKVIVLLGSTPLSLLVHLQPISKYEGMQVFNIPDVKAKVFAAFHPAYILRAPSKEARLAAAIATAANAANIEVNSKQWEERRMFNYEIRA
ncbi:MAG: uracil-DNA glycosylase [Gammaproteobacteria bacterium]|nr:uracil-DNA glycosylase [Gammaproteobacteria bacterium]